MAPTYNYWTDDPLKYAGTGSAACYVTLAGGTSYASATAPMRVCAGATDPLGNTCNWYDCGFNTVSPNEYFGGCNSNYTAGTLCCPN